MARDLTLAAAATAGALAVQVVRHLEAIRGYEAPPLPAFDAYVYVAMAEHPTVFTVAPWGHRILTPWLVRAVPFAPIAVAFPIVTVGAFALACLLLFAFLRQRGHRAWAASLGVLAFALSPPVGELIAAPFLVEPLACALLVALLLALETGLGLGTLALIAVLGVLAKEVVLLFLPVVYFATRKEGRGGAARDATLVLALATASLLLLRLVWTPNLRTPLPDLGTERFRLIGSRHTQNQYQINIIRVGIDDHDFDGMVIAVGPKSICQIAIGCLGLSNVTKSDGITLQHLVFKRVNGIVRSHARNAGN